MNKLYKEQEFIGVLRMNSCFEECGIATREKKTHGVVWKEFMSEVWIEIVISVCNYGFIPFDLSSVVYMNKE